MLPQVEEVWGSGLYPEDAASDSGPPSGFGGEERGFPSTLGPTSALTACIPVRPGGSGRSRPLHDVKVRGAGQLAVRNPSADSVGPAATDDQPRR